MTHTIDAERHARQILLEGIGPQGQQRLLSARVLLVGCGALGSNVINMLVRAGVGHLTIVDRDYVEINNLARQVLFDETDVARNVPKAIAAAEKCARTNSAVVIEPVVADFNHTNAERLVRDADVVLDGTDNFETRYLINDACVKLGTPWIYGGVVASTGMTVAVLPGSTPCFLSMRVATLPHRG